MTTVCQYKLKAVSGPPTLRDSLPAQAPSSRACQTATVNPPLLLSLSASELIIEADSYLIIPYSSGVGGKQQTGAEIFILVVH